MADQVSSSPSTCVTSTFRVSTPQQILCAVWHLLHFHPLIFPARTPYRTHNPGKFQLVYTVFLATPSSQQLPRIDYGANKYNGISSILHFHLLITPQP